MKHSKSNTIIASIALTTALLAACSGGGDATAPAETPTPATPAGITAVEPAPTPAPTAEPTTGYGYVTNPAGGNYGNQCAKDYATGLIWEGKNPNPTHPQGIGRTYTNYDNAAASQVRISTPACPSCTRQPTAGEVSAGTNSLGYRNSINSAALCGFSDWRLPTRDELIALGNLNSKLTDFPETSSGTYWSSSAADRDDNGVVVRPPDTAGNKESRGGTFGLRLVRSSR
jgi:Protein of unknown function (DUF1566)